MVSDSAYFEFADFIMEAGATPEQIVAFRPSDNAERRFEDLTERFQEGVLTGDEKAELEQILQFDHLMRMVKARAAQKLSVLRAS